MGAPHARWTLYCIVTAAWHIANSDLNNLLKADSEHPHDYSTNLWWQLMNKTAYEGEATNCYVCAHLPYATQNSGLRPAAVSTAQQACLYGLSTHAGTGSWAKRDYSVPLSNEVKNTHTDLDRRLAMASMGYDFASNCSITSDVMPLPQMSIKLPELITVSHLSVGALGYCVYNNGTTPVGLVPWNLCDKVYSFCDITRKKNAPNYIHCVFCRAGRPYAKANCSKFEDVTDCTQLLEQRPFNVSLQTRGRQKSTHCSLSVPGDKGSRVLTDWYFLCGHRAYTALPPDWGGLCALVPLSNPMFVLRKALIPSAHRTRRSPMPEVKRWGGLTTTTGVPWEFRIWNGGEKFFQGLFPFVGVGEVRDHVEVNRYALLRLINDTYHLANGTLSELSGLKQMILQNRVVLDLLTASQGGVCKIIGETCCTYIPDETGTGGDIHDALHELSDLKNYVESGTRGANPVDLWSWFISGPWWHLLLKICIPLLTVLFLFCILFSCVIPLLKKMMMKAFTGVLISLHQTRLEQNEDDFTPLKDEC